MTARAPAAFGMSRQPGERWTRFATRIDRKSTRLNSSHSQISYAVFCLKKKNNQFEICSVSLCSCSNRCLVTYLLCPDPHYLHSTRPQHATTIPTPRLRLVLRLCPATLS